MSNQKLILWIISIVVVVWATERYFQLRKIELNNQSLMLKNGNGLVHNQTEPEKIAAIKTPMRPIGFRRSSEDDIA